MAHTAKDGSKWTNPQQARFADERFDAKQSEAPAPEESNDESSDPSEVVAQHGPAKVVSITHDEAKHSVKSKHEDGHAHHSEHASASEAHDAAKTLSGVGQEQPEESTEGPDGSAGLNPSAMMMG